MCKELKYSDFSYALKLSFKYILCLKLIKTPEGVKAKTCLFERVDNDFKSVGRLTDNKLYRTRKGMFYIKRKLPDNLSLKAADLLYLDDFTPIKALDKN